MNPISMVFAVIVAEVVTYATLQEGTLGQQLTLLAFDAAVLLTIVAVYLKHDPAPLRSLRTNIACWWFDLQYNVAAFIERFRANPDGYRRYALIRLRQAIIDSMLALIWAFGLLVTLRLAIVANELLIGQELMAWLFPYLPEVVLDVMAIGLWIGTFILGIRALVNKMDKRVEKSSKRLKEAWISHVGVEA